MTDFDAIIVGAGHNGLTAATVLQRAGLRTLCLEANTYSGGMAATVELIDGFKYEIAGSVRFPTAQKINSELGGLDTLPTIESEIMSVNLGGEKNGEEAMIFHSDPMAMMTHLSEKHGMEAVMAMANLYAWSTGPGKALGRFDALALPKTIDEMYACAADESERRAIHEMLFGSAMDVVDRFLPDKEKHAVIRGMLAFLAVNSTYRGPYTPGSATCLAFAMAMPPEGGQMTTKLKGGIGVLADHLRDLFVEAAGEIRYRTKVEQILVEDGKVTGGVRLKDGEIISAPVVVSNLAPETTLLDLVGVDHLPSSLVTRWVVETTAHRSCRSTSPSTVHPNMPRPTTSSTSPACKCRSACLAHRKNNSANGRRPVAARFRTTRRCRFRCRQSAIPRWPLPASMRPACTPTASPSKPRAISMAT